MNDQISKHCQTDPYWHQVALVLEQIAGLEDGFEGKFQEPRTNVSVFGMYLFNVGGDLEDLEFVLKKETKKRILGSGSCSALIKVLPDNSDIYVSQDTWNNFNSMLRILKFYDFGFHTLPEGGEVVAGHAMSFSSYPGSVLSGDDFYTISSGLATLETTIGNGNMSLYDNITPDGIVFEFIRALVANRLTSNGRSWSELFSLFNSGTYNNEWMVLDYKLFEAGKPLKNGLLYVLDQLPVYIEYGDLTDVLREQTYFPSYNSPFFDFIFNVSGGPDNVKKFGDWFSYDKTPRALIFRRDHKKVVDLDSMVKLMRYNDYRHDPLSACNCTPPFSAENAIAARSDLNPADGVYPFGALGHRQHGATDVKLTNNEMVKKLQFVAVGGPPHGDVPPFQWSSSDFDKKVPHEGHPDLWVFDPVVPEWDYLTEFDNNFV